MYFAELEKLYVRLYPEPSQVVFEIKLVLRSGHVEILKSRSIWLPWSADYTIEKINELLQSLIREQSRTPIEIYGAFVVPAEIALYSIRQIA
jgi:hypothetical protein